MNANRFFSVSYDVRHNPKVEMLGEMQGGRMAALGRWIALLSLLYDADGAIVLDSDVKRRFVARELEMPPEELDGFMDDCVEAGLIDAGALRERGTVTSRGVADQVAYRQMKSNAGRKGAKARKAAKK